MTTNATPFVAQRTIRLTDTDAAGVIYFARALDLAHSVYEDWLESNGWRLNDVLHDTPWMVPIVNAEVNHNAPLVVGDKVTIEMTAKRIGTTSFTLAYSFRHGDHTAARATTTHVTVERATRKPRPLEADLRAALEAL